MVSIPSGKLNEILKTQKEKMIMKSLRNNKFMQSKGIPSERFTANKTPINRTKPVMQTKLKKPNTGYGMY
jgi:hypothetical protein